jgi:hypothetical protein
MAAVTLSAVVDLSKIKMKWKEVYVSEGLNRKVIPAMPKGIYRGLRLIQNISSPRQVEVAASPDGTHNAIHESATGFSTTYHDVTGASTILDLSSASLDNQETIIALSVNYTIGADTTANWIAYPIADWNALTDEQRAEKIVVGTVNVPAPATNITTSMITPNRRTVSWENEAGGKVPWSTLIRNGGFEHGVTGELTRYAISDWDKGTIHTNGEFRLGTTTVRSGSKSLEFNKTATAASFDAITQSHEIPVTPGMLVKITCWIKQLIAETGGGTWITIGWGDQDSSLSSNTDIFIGSTSVDASFRKIEETVEVPAGSSILKGFGIATNIVTASTGVAFAIDDVQVYLEPGSPQVIPGALDARLSHKLVTSVVFEDSDSYQIGQIAALMRFTQLTPTGEGSLVVERRDQVAGSLPPALSLAGRVSGLGANLLNSEANALKARITAGVSVVGGVEYTLMWESVPSGQPGHRRYVSAAGYLVDTFNARYDGTNWNKDVAGTAALRATLGGAFPYWYISDRNPTANTPWTDASWSTDMVYVQGDSAATYCFQTFRPALLDSTVRINGVLSLAGNLTLLGSNYVHAPGTLYLGRQRFTANGTYTPTSGTTRVRLRMVGGGGGGGGAATHSSASTATGCSGGGGASGTFVEVVLTGSPVTGGSVTIGGAGAGSGGSPTGGTGGDTTITINATLFTAKGGLGGHGGASNLSVPNTDNGGQNQSGSSSGDFTSGQPGAKGVALGNAGSDAAVGGRGGSSPLGAGGAGGETFTSGSAATGFGAGGGGGANWNNTTGTSGGNGSAGIVIIDEYR